MKRKALGKGLRSLIPEAPPASTTPAAAAPNTAAGLLQIDIDRIHPNRSQPRQHFEQVQLEELAASIRQEGVLQPVIVRPLRKDEFELIAGERRWRAAQLAGLLKVPAVVREVSDERLLELALIENLQREELSAIEEARAYQTLIDDLGLTQQEVADRVGKQRATVSNALRLLNLPQPVLVMIQDGRLAAGHAKALVALANTKAQVDLAERIAREGLSVRAVESAVARAAAAEGRPARGASSAVRDPNVVAAEERLQSALGTKVRIVPGRKGGRLELYFYSDEELQGFYDTLMRAAQRRQ